MIEPGSGCTGVPPHRREALAERIAAASRRLLPAVAVFAAVAGTAVPVLADVSILAGSCANCHGPEGRSPGAIPSIAGQPRDVLRAQLEAFRAGEPAEATVMPRLMRAYSDAEIDALAAWFSEVAP